MDMSKKKGGHVSITCSCKLLFLVSMETEAQEKNMLCSCQNLLSRRWTPVTGLSAGSVSTHLQRVPGAPPSPGSWLVLVPLLSKPERWGVCLLNSGGLFHALKPWRRRHSFKACSHCVTGLGSWVLRNQEAQSRAEWVLCESASA